MTSYYTSSPCGCLGASWRHPMLEKEGYPWASPERLSWEPMDTAVPQVLWSVEGRANAFGPRLCCTDAWDGAKGARGLGWGQVVHTRLCYSVLACTMWLGERLQPLRGWGEEQTRWCEVSPSRCTQVWTTHKRNVPSQSPSKKKINGVKFLDIRRSGEFKDFKRRVLKFSLVSAEHCYNFPFFLCWLKPPLTKPFILLSLDLTLKKYSRIPG